MEHRAALLIEDDPDVRNVVSQMLEGLGYSVTACQDVAQAVAEFEGGRACDIVITDVMMPGTSGLELITLLRRWRAKTPVVLITGKRDAIESAIGDGFVPLLKPFTSEQLRTVLDDALRILHSSRRA